MNERSHVRVRRRDGAAEHGAADDRREDAGVAVEPVSIRVSANRAGRRFDAEHGVATEALVFLGDLDPEAIGPSLAHATHYEPTPVGDLERLLALVPFAFENATFVDVGSGMGRAVLVAARHPFRRAIGIEISPALHAVALDNLARFDRSALACRDLRFVRADALAFAWPRGRVVAYFYNPFGATILEPIVARLAARAGDVAIVYHTPVARDVVDTSRAFALVAETPLGLVYERRRTGDAAP